MTTLNTPEIQNRLKKIKILMLDVDGVLTDGRVFWIEGQGWTRNFHVKDGYGLKLLIRSGIDVAAISGGDSKDVRARMEGLNVKHLYLGDEDKLKAFQKILKDTGFTPEQVAFVADDLYDLPVLDLVGFSATVPDAVEEVKARVHYITTTPGGIGAVREIADAIRKAQGL